MRKFYLPFLIIALLAMASLSCSRKANLVPETVGSEYSDSGDGRKDSDNGGAYGLQTVHFDYDSSDLTSGTLKILKTNAEILKKNSGLQIQVEGHCDERGSIQYNLALGERRAKKVLEQLQIHGIPPARMTMISFGKERPVASGDDEASHARNRRGNFEVTGE